MQQIEIADVDYPVPRSADTAELPALTELRAEIHRGLERHESLARDCVNRFLDLAEANVRTGWALEDAYTLVTRTGNQWGQWVEQNLAIGQDRAKKLRRLAAFFSRDLVDYTRRKASGLEPLPATSAPVRATFDWQQPPVTLLPTEELNDFTRNFRELEKRSKRAYSLTRTITELSSERRLTGLEAECDAELRTLCGSKRDVNGALVPIEIFNRDLSNTTGVGKELVQTAVAPQILPFLRTKSVVGRLGATLMDGLAPGPLKLPRTTVGGTATWLAETGGVVAADQNFDTVLLSPSRISGQTIISNWLLKTAVPDVEAFVIGDLSAAIANAVDKAALTGSGVAPVPAGILSLSANAANVYTDYTKRSPDVVFAAAATWAEIVAFEANLENAGIFNLDGSYGWVTDVATKQKWQTISQGGTYPKWLWEKVNNDIVFDRVCGRRSIATNSMPAGTAIFGAWSNCVVATWAGLEVVSDPYMRASQGETIVTANLLTGVGFKYGLAFCANSGSTTQ
jgi:HK97 family phage major capsid protein